VVTISPNVRRPSPAKPHKFVRVVDEHGRVEMLLS
jgi:hypothetical protein